MIGSKQERYKNLKITTVSFESHGTFVSSKIYKTVNIQSHNFYRYRAFLSKSVIIHNTFQ